jgi:hypothetical protein
VALAPLTRPIPLPLPLPLAGESLIVNGRARPDACSSAALATISALSASLAARVRLRAGSSTTISFPFLLSQPITILEATRMQRHGGVQATQDARPAQWRTGVAAAVPVSVSGGWRCPLAVMRRRRRNECGKVRVAAQQAAARRAAERRRPARECGGRRRRERWSKAASGRRTARRVCRCGGG